MKPKKTIYIFPSYVGSLRYYEKLLDFLGQEFEVLIIVAGDWSLRNYCELKKLPHIVLDVRLSKKKITGRIPIISPIINRVKFIKAAEVFFDAHKPDVIVTSPPRTYYLLTIARIARERGIKTLGLQWSLTARENNHKQKFSVYFTSIKSFPSLFVSVMIWFHQTLLRGILFLGDVYKRKKIFLLPLCNVDALGVIDGLQKQVFAEKTGFDIDKMTVVGTYESEMVRELVAHIEHDENRKVLYAKYGFASHKKIIFVVSMTFNAANTSTYVMTHRGQIDYFMNIFRMLRKQFPKDTHEIIFKMHPREMHIYQDAENLYGVMCIGSDGINEELIALSDLCITHPLTTLNFPIVASGKPTICINFSPLNFLDDCGKYYGFSKIVKSTKVFATMLQEHGEGTLPLQYDAEFIVPNAKAKILSFIKRYI